MERNTNKFAILWLLTSIVVLTPVCSLVESSPRPVQPPLNAPAATGSDQTDDAFALLSQPTATEPRVSFSLNEESDRAFQLAKDSSANTKPAPRADLDVWYGEYFKTHNLRVLGASPIEREPSRIGLKISFTF